MGCWRGSSTYPLQVIATSRWLEKDDNKNLKGDALVKALHKESWDPSSIGTASCSKGSGSEHREDRGGDRAVRSGSQLGACRCGERLATYVSVKAVVGLYE